jgi:hypothetical protein
MRLGRGRDGGDPSMTAILHVKRYDVTSALHRSDQITVPAEVWERFHEAHDGGRRPLFVAIGDSAEVIFDSGVVGRLRPGPRGGDECLVPNWMWLRLGAPDGDYWGTVMERPIPDAEAITLRPRQQATLGESADPLGLLTAALSGAAGGGEHGWACLTIGMELPLACGVFDVVDIKSCEGWSVGTACILDMDVRLDLVAALDAVAVAVAPVPRPAPVPVAVPKGVMWFHGMENVIDGNYWARPKGEGYRA